MMIGLCCSVLAAACCHADVQWLRWGLTPWGCDGV